MKSIEKFLAAGSIFFFLSIVAVVVLQVVTRLIPQIATPSWTEEASRFLFIYTVAFAAPLALIRGEYVKVDLLSSRLSPKNARILDITIYVALTIFFGIITYQGIQYILFNRYQTSPAMGLRMVIPYSSVAFMAFFMTIYAFIITIKKIRGDE